MARSRPGSQATLLNPVANAEQTATERAEGFVKPETAELEGQFSRMRRAYRHDNVRDGQRGLEQVRGNARHGRSKLRGHRRRNGSA